MPLSRAQSAPRAWKGLLQQKLGDMYDSKEARNSDNEPDDPLGFRWRRNERQLFDRAAFLLFCRCFTCLTPWNCCIWFPHWLSHPEGTLWSERACTVFILERSFSFGQDHLFSYWRVEPLLQGWLGRCHKILCPFSHLKSWTWWCSTSWFLPSCSLSLSGSLIFWALPILIGKNTGMKRIRTLTLDNKSFIKFLQFRYRSHRLWSECTVAESFIQALYVGNICVICSTCI